MLLNAHLTVSKVSSRHRSASMHFYRVRKKITIMHKGSLVLLFLCFNLTLILRNILYAPKSLFRVVRFTEWVTFYWQGGFWFQDGGRWMNGNACSARFLGPEGPDSPFAKGWMCSQPHWLCGLAWLYTSMHSRLWMKWKLKGLEKVFWNCFNSF